MTDRDTLLGLLAVQTKLITPEAFRMIHEECERQDAMPLSRVLVLKGLLQEKIVFALEALAEGQIAQPGNSARQAIVALMSSGILQAQAVPDANTTGSEPVPDTIGSTPRADSSVGDPFETRAPDDQQQSVGAGVPVGSSRYRILRLLAQGGLGEVFVARDEEINRDVALKEIQGRYADEPTSRARFLREAKLTGQLEHPGIVPIYGLGIHLDGRPFYAMRLVYGESLTEAISRLHKRRNEPRIRAGYAPMVRKLLGRFIAVCNAVGYAHSRGVLHRDLKPDNIMLGSYGETYVVDWGLATRLGRADRGAGEEATLHPKPDRSAVMTQQGSILGTPAYMSPEQAEGRLDQLSPASDIYSLGATLYHLLTGEPPFGGASVQVVLEKARQGQFIKPRKLNPGIPPPLQAICLKAMARYPVDRYPSAESLADDVDAFSADELVTAYRYSGYYRLNRWVRRLTQSGFGILTVFGLTWCCMGVVNMPEKKRESEREKELRNELQNQRNRAREAEQRLQEFRRLDVKSP